MTHQAKTMLYSSLPPSWHGTYWLRPWASNDIGRIGTIMDVRMILKLNAPLPGTDFDSLARLYTWPHLDQSTCCYAKWANAIGAMLFIDFDNLKYVNVHMGSAGSVSSSSRWVFGRLALGVASAYPAMSLRSIYTDKLKKSWTVDP